MIASLSTEHDADELRDLLDARVVGPDLRVGGLDAQGRPFIAELSGPYADTEVTYHDPWDSEVSYSTGKSCPECGAHRAGFGLDSLHFPVAVSSPIG